MTRLYIEGFKLNTRAITGYANALTREQLLTRPMGNANHFIWILGHITMIRGTLIRLFGGRSGITKEEQQLFGPGSKVLEQDNYPSTEELIALFTGRGEELCALLGSANEETMKEESPFKFAFGEKVKGDTLHFLYWHEATHYGELNYLHKMLSRNTDQ